MQGASPQRTRGRGAPASNGHRPQEGAGVGKGARRGAGALQQPRSKPSIDRTLWQLWGSMWGQRKVPQQ